MPGRTLRSPSWPTAPPVLPTWSRCHCPIRCPKPTSRVRSRPSTWVMSRRTATVPRWARMRSRDSRALALAITWPTPRRDGGRARDHHRVRQGASAVRRAHRFVPGGAAPARRSAGAGRGLAQRGAARGVGRRRAAVRDALEAGVGRQGVLRQRRRAPSARPRSRCTAGSATRGSASCTCTCAGRCCRRSCSATRDTTCARSRTTPGDEREPAMDFDDSPAGGRVPGALPRLAGRQQPGPAGLVDRRRVLGEAGRVALRAVRRRVLRIDLAQGLRRAGAADRSTR